MQDGDFQRFITNVKRKTGIDLSLYKETQMKRRLTSLYLKRGYANFSAYYDAISRDDQLYHEFLDRITINVSEFFRNPGRWEVLGNKILPRLLNEKRKLRCWSAACSTGEEPYSLAMILSRFIPLKEVDILATDIDEGAIAKAKMGIYPERSIQDCPVDLLRRYFVKEGNSYRIADEIKRSVSFKKHNLLADMYRGPYDLIICRNVLIYFTEEAKNQIYHKFSDALRYGGVLFVGSTEQIFHPAEYRLVPEDTFFYRKMTD